MNNSNSATKTWVISSIVIIVAIFIVWWWLKDPAHSIPFIGNPVSSATTTAPQATSTPNTNGSTVATNQPSGTIRVDRSGNDVETVLKELDGSSLFAGLFASTGVGTSISASTSTKYTIFVPTNGAISQMSPKLSTLTAAQKKRLVQYHVIVGRAMDTDALVAGQLQALSGDMLNFNYGANKIPMVNSAIVVTEYKAKNGIVIVIDNVLVPPTR